MKKRFSDSGRKMVQVEGRKFIQSGREQERRRSCDRERKIA